MIDNLSSMRGFVYIPSISVSKNDELNNSFAVMLTLKTISGDPILYDLITADCLEICYHKAVTQAFYYSMLWDFLLINTSGKILVPEICSYNDFLINGN